MTINNGGNERDISIDSVCVFTIVIIFTIFCMNRQKCAISLPFASHPSLSALIQHQPYGWIFFFMILIQFSSYM
jgi:hypothetical protein